jgi:catechol 2,3-dioxygenase-like lactoylglutathione lyase family enzyme
MGTPVWTSLDHVVIGAADLERSANCLARLLGRRPSWRGEHPDQGTANVLFRLGNTYLEILSPQGESPVAAVLREHLEREGEGLLGLALGTGDVDAAYALLRERGLEPASPRAGVGRDVDSGAFRQWRSVWVPPARARGLLVLAIEHRSPPDLLPPAPASCAEAAAVAGLDHVVLQTADAEASRAFWGDALGLRLALDRRFEAWGVRLLFFRVGGITVELAAALDGAATERPADRDRAWGLSYRVPDADAARARVAEAGFDVSPVRPGRRPGTRVFSVRGEPCGVATLMLEPPPNDSPAG